MSGPYVATVSIFFQAQSPFGVYVILKVSLDTLRAPSRSTTSTSIASEFRGSVDLAWSARGYRFQRMLGVPGAPGRKILRIFNGVFMLVDMQHYVHKIVCIGRLGERFVDPPGGSKSWKADVNRLRRQVPGK